MYKNGKPNYNEIVFSEEEIEDIIKSYINGESSVKIAKRYGLGSHKSILKLLHKNNIVVDKKNSNKYKINHNYFDNIDSEVKAYCLGFLYADGCNVPNKATVSMSLQEEDAYILDLLREDMNNERPLEFIDYSNKHDGGYNYKNQYRMLIFSKNICDKLNEIGMTPSKSLTLEFPNIDKYLYKHFIRGYFDGDGSLYANYKNENNIAVCVTITSTNQFCNSIKEICNNEIGINTNIYDASCHNGITKVFTLSGRNICKEFLDWIYKDATIYLKRKYNRYLEYYNLNNSLVA